MKRWLIRGERDEVRIEREGDISKVFPSEQVLNGKKGIRPPITYHGRFHFVFFFMKSITQIFFSLCLFLPSDFDSLEIWIDPLNNLFCHFSEISQYLVLPSFFSSSSKNPNSAFCLLSYRSRNDQLRFLLLLKTIFSCHQMLDSCDK